MASYSSNSHAAPSGYKRLTLDISAEDHARFKSICALHQTTMGAEITAMIGAQLADPDALLSEALYIRVSPQLKRELLDYARERRVSLTDLLIEAFGLLQPGALHYHARGDPGNPAGAAGPPQLPAF
jgi:hypothetical protein